MLRVAHISISQNTIFSLCFFFDSCDKSWNEVALNAFYTTAEQRVSRRRNTPC